MSRLQRAGRFVAQEGWGGFVQLVWTRLTLLALGRPRSIVIELDLTGLGDVGKPRVEAECRWLDAERIGLLVQRSYTSRAEIDRRLGEGERCLLVFSGDVLLAYVWAAFGRAPMPELKQIRPLATDEVYVYNSRTFPEARGKGIYTYMMHSTAALLRDEGYRRMIGLIFENNVAPLRGTRKVGFQAISIESSGGLLARPAARATSWAEIFGEA